MICLALLLLIETVVESKFYVIETKTNDKSGRHQHHDAVQGEKQLVEEAGTDYSWTENGHGWNGPDEGKILTTQAPCTDDCCGWASWGPWSQPSNTCTSSQVRRTRNCEKAVPEYTGVCMVYDCAGNGVEAKTEQGGVCCSWSGWTEGSCSTTCGAGYKTKQRTCKCEGRGNWGHCPGEPSAQIPCNEDVACPVPYAAAAWVTTTTTTTTAGWRTTTTAGWRQTG